MKRLVAVFAILAALAGGVPSVTDAQDRTIGERVDDAKITATVKAKLTADQVKNLVNVDVDTRNGIVHLQGMVPSAQDKTAAERLARGTKGVVDVRNDLRVATATPGMPGTSGSASPATR